MDNFLAEGEQTKISETITAAAQTFTNAGISLVFEILSWTHSHLSQSPDPAIKNELFRKRTADEIIRSGFATGCTDYALAFIALARASGIPAQYVETIKKSWIESPDMNRLEGHVFSEVLIKETWYVVDPQGGSVRLWYPNLYVIAGKGLDSWDLHMRSIEDVKREFQKMITA